MWDKIVQLWNSSTFSEKCTVAVCSVSAAVGIYYGGKYLYRWWYGFPKPSNNNVPLNEVEREASTDVEGLAMRAKIFKYIDSTFVSHSPTAFSGDPFSFITHLVITFEKEHGKHFAYYPECLNYFMMKQNDYFLIKHTNYLESTLAYSEYNNNFSTYNPLESFTIIFENFNHKFFDNLSFNMFFNFFLIVFIFSMFIFNTKSLFESINIIKIFGNIFNFFFYMFKNFIKNLRFERFFLFLIAFFIFILFSNFGGFSLYELSFTSHAAITLFLSFILFFNYFINIFINFNEKIYEKFIQKNLSLFLTFVLFFIELISFFIRPFSLGIRLFANILSGHILIHIFFNAFIYFYKIIFWLSFFLLVFCFFILFLEIFVACVQSYIFLILSFIYLQDVSNLH